MQTTNETTSGRHPGHGIFRTLGLTLTFVVLAMMPWGSFEQRDISDSIVPGKASVEDLKATYRKWEAGYRTTKPAGPRVALVWNRGLSSQFSASRGVAQIDLDRQLLSVRIFGLEDQTLSDVWLVQNTPGEGRSIVPEPGDRMIKAGRLTFERDDAWLDAKVIGLDELETHWIIIARRDGNPATSGVLFGSTSLFQRIYHYRREVGLATPDQHQRGFMHGTAAHASGTTPPGFFPDLDSRQVNEGRRLFFNETFEGNGRTCGTCHPENNNLTIDPKFIAGLPDEDPLFVVEQTMRPDGTVNPLFQDFRFEKPELMRKVGLILENTNGFGDLESNFTMRAVNSVLSIGTSIEPPPLDFDDGTLPGVGDPIFTQRTGWSGDGAPVGERAGFVRELDGSLRDFAVGAVVQHFTRTLTRSAIQGRNGESKPDFRFPTEQELDALEAFMLSLGRQQEPDNLIELQLVDELADRGRLNFIGINLPADPNGVSCNSCHNNGGANTEPGFVFPDAITPPAGEVSHNRSFAPRVEELIDQAGDVIVELSDDPSLAGDANPFDDGFGPRTLPIRDNLFNTQVVIESADTPPFFHGHQINTVEAAVAFYSSPRHLRDGTVLPPIVPLNGAQVANVGRFMRVMNAVFNASSARTLLLKAAQLRDPHLRRENVQLALAEIDDAIEVLEGAQLHYADAVPLLLELSEQLGDHGFSGGQRRSLLQSIEMLEEVESAMIVRDSF